MDYEISKCPIIKSIYFGKHQGLLFLILSLGTQEYYYNASYLCRSIIYRYLNESENIPLQIYSNINLQGSNIFGPAKSKRFFLKLGQNIFLNVLKKVWF